MAGLRAVVRNNLRWQVIALIFMGTILNYLARNSLGVLAPLLQTRLHITTAQYSYVVGAFQLAYTLMLPSIAKSRSASSSRMAGLLPPSSNVTFLMVLDAWRMISRPTSVLPVKAILSTNGLIQSSGPTTSPGPVIMLRTPGGNNPVSWIISIILRALSGV